MTVATRCSCGFVGTEHEGVIDHLMEVFVPPDSRGNDGMIHEEGVPLTCSCGFTAATTDDLDAHFLAVFTPADSVGSDDKTHQPQ
jgi:hypothetical protein